MAKAAGFRRHYSGEDLKENDSARIPEGWEFLKDGKEGFLPLLFETLNNDHWQKLGLWGEALMMTQVGEKGMLWWMMTETENIAKAWGIWYRKNSKKKKIHKSRIKFSSWKRD